MTRRLYFLSLFLILAFFTTYISDAQMPGMDFEKSKEQASGKTSVADTGKKTEPKLVSDSEKIDSSQVGEVEELKQGVFQSLYDKYFGPESAYRPLILIILTLIVLLRLKKYLSAKIHDYVKLQAYHPENVQSFMKVWNGIWTRHYGFVQLRSRCQDTDALRNIIT